MLLRIEGTKYLIDAPPTGPPVYLVEERPLGANGRLHDDIDSFQSVDDCLEFFRQWKGDNGDASKD